MHTKLRERFRYKVKPGKKKYWVALISEELYTDGYLLLPVRPLQEVIDEFSRFTCMCSKQGMMQIPLVSWYLSL